MLPDLATPADLTSYGYPDVAGGFLARASARVRRHTRQQITAGTSTVALPSWPYRLPQRPVVEVVSVETSDGTQLAYELSTSGVLKVRRHWGGPIHVTYDHGFDELPDELVELVCSIAARLSRTPDAVSSGATSEQAGGEAVAWGSDAWRGTTGLTAEEKAALDRLFPKVPATVALRP